ncbi:MAG: cyclomaltodextrinase N-terminal domain-containing protein [Proteobacteria bacterium]|nr:cyclomaltodextrinase N-terminal domain-containing protein [Pseudomonadota bacterium]MBS1642353.1 cyclomaltodextrinase N-terminal domain-containing protein [Bacteroidota bacterium]MBS1669840.1 cyclomaltodextrinase N-terminal domain-containing protein [Bacteroidota bacterium]
MKKIFILTLLMVAQFSLLAQTVEVYPTNWWVGMKHHQIQLLIKNNTNLVNAKININYPGIIVKNIHVFENTKYVSVDINIAATAKPGNVPIVLNWGNKKTETILWELKARRNGLGTQYAQGVNSNDFVYFLMPDRFSNGDESNDRVAGYKDQSLNRDSIYLRHGGDLQGIINHLDYIQNLGATTVWLTPVIENDMPNRTEHGYAFTNHYKIDKRLGGEEAYLKLSDELHKRGMKLMQDAVYNHVGLWHWMQQDPPSKDWIHQWPTFTQPNYKEQVFFDPYASEKDKKQMADGWFTKEMPDVNQSNPYVANFLIQHAIWCVEKFGVDGWRIDTYKYVDLDFMNRCNKALTDEYPNITMVGENWCEGIPNQAYFTVNKLNTKYKSNLTGAIDFEILFKGIQPALTQQNGVNSLYNTMSLDFLYEHPLTNLVFLDNHDMSRFYSVVDSSVAKQKMGLAWLFTTRGIPQLYYGTEILMGGKSYPHDGDVRLDFPGGWKGDKKNAFTGNGLTADEKNVQQYTKILADYRKQTSALRTGKLMQYIPSNGLYVYFRYDEKNTIMCVMNTDKDAKNISFSNYTERTKNFSSAIEITTGNKLLQTFSIPAQTMWVLQLK